MRNRGRGRGKGGRRLAGPATINPAHTILSITDDGSGNMLVTTAGPHGLTGSEPITITGTSRAIYNNGGHVCDSAPTATTWLEFGTFVGNSSGGTWAIT